MDDNNDTDGDGNGDEIDEEDMEVDTAAIEWVILGGLLSINDAGTGNRTSVLCPVIGRTGSGDDDSDNDDDGGGAIDGTCTTGAVAAAPTLLAGDANEGCNGLVYV
jgi:hypothetical protein